MLADFSALRHQVRALGRRGSAGYPPELRGRLVAAAQELRAARCSWETVADNLGVSVGFIRQACSDTRPPGLVPVQVVTHAAATPITLHSPNGWRIEGLRLDDLPALVAALS
jgi:hypothetical protein